MIDGIKADKLKYRCLWYALPSNGVTGVQIETADLHGRL